MTIMVFTEHLQLYPLFLKKSNFRNFLQLYIEKAKPKFLFGSAISQAWPACATCLRFLSVVHGTGRRLDMVGGHLCPIQSCLKALLPKLNPRVGWSLCFNLSPFLFFFFGRRAFMPDMLSKSNIKHQKACSWQAQESKTQTKNIKISFFRCSVNFSTELQLKHGGSVNCNQWLGSFFCL